MLSERAHDELERLRKRSAAVEANLAAFNAGKPFEDCLVSAIASLDAMREVMLKALKDEYEDLVDDPIARASAVRVAEVRLRLENMRAAIEFVEKGGV